MIKGYGFCIWWRLQPNHPISIVSKELSKKIKTPPFEAHISVRTKLSCVPSELPHQEHKIQAKLPLRVTSEYLYMWGKTLYALELPFEYTYPLPRNAHISLAYRFNKGFSAEEVDMAEEMLQSYDKWNIISKTQSVVYDVTSPLVKWTQVK